MFHRAHRSKNNKDLNINGSKIQVRFKKVVRTKQRPKKRSLVQRMLPILITAAAVVLVLYRCSSGATDATSLSEAEEEYNDDAMNDFDWSGGGVNANGYRLGDAFVAWYLDWLSWDEMFDIYASRYPNSVAHLYLAEVEEPEYAMRNLTALLRVLDRKEEQVHYRRAKEDELVIHVRLGDVLTDPSYTDLDKSMETLWTQYEGFVNFDANYKSNYNMWEFEELIGRIPEKDLEKLTKCVIVGGNYLTLQDNQNRNKEYVDLLTAYLQGIDCEVSFYTSQNPDKDLMFMASAHWFIGAMGGFAQIAAACVTARRGWGHAIYDYFNGRIASYNADRLSEEQHKMFNEEFIDWDTVDIESTKLKGKKATVHHFS